MRSFLSFPRQRWRALLLLLCLLGAGAYLAGWDELLPSLVQTWLWRVLGLGAVALVAIALPGQVGPLFWYDLVRTARQGHRIAHRCLYAGLLGIVLLLVYSLWFPQLTWIQLLTEGGRFRSVSEAARFGDALLNFLLILQFAALVLITPLYTADAIAREKESRTIDLFLTTDLTSREILLGLLGSRLATLVLLVLTALPVLSSMELLGGASPLQLLLWSVLAMLTMVSLGSMSLAVSVSAPTSVRAMTSAYLWTCLVFVPLAIVGVIAVELALFEQLPVLVVLGVLSALHGTIALFCLLTARTVLREQIHPSDMARMAAGPVRLPGVILSPPTVSESAASPLEGTPMSSVPSTYRATIDGSLDAIPRKGRPPVGANALLWKEQYERQFSIAPEWWGCLIFVAVMVIPILLGGMLQAYNFGGPPAFHDVVRSNVYCSTLVLSWVLFLGIALGAAGRITRERQRQTLDGLLTLPVERHEILFAKWRASVSAPWLCWWGLAIGWLLGTLTGGVHPLALLLFLVAWTVYASFFAMLGLAFSTFCQSNVRAHLLAVLTVAALLAGPPILRTRSFGEDPWTAMQWQLPSWEDLILNYGVDPWSLLRLLLGRFDHLLSGPVPLAVKTIVATLSGQGVYLLLTAILWLAIRVRFERECGPRARPLRHLRRHAPVATSALLKGGR